MEEGYRMQKAAEEERKSQKIVISPPPPQEKEIKKGEVANAKTNGVNDLSRSVQAISISGDSDGDNSENMKEKELEDADEKVVSNNEVTNGRDENDDDEKENSSLKIADGRSLNSENMEEVDLDDEKSNSNSKSKTASVIEFKGPELEKPLQAANEDKNDNQSIHNDDQTKDASTKKDYSFSFNNKRLCERWLDNLFMVLYEDLRVYTVWRSEVSHYKAHHMSYRKTGTEWEILGDLAARLHHKDDAKEAYQRCLEHKFSAKAWLRLLEFYADEGDVQRALQAVVKLTVYYERWYHEIVYPTAIAYNINKLIRSEGLSKINYNLISMNLSPPVNKLVSRYLEFADTFKIPGSDF